MKIRFTKLPTTDGTIKVSLDGGNSFNDYNVADVHESGIPLEDSQDYEKIQIQAPANVLKNLNVVSGVKVEGDVGQEHESLPITPIYYKLRESACGQVFRLKESGCDYSPDYNFDPIALYVQIDGSYTSLSSLCEYCGDFNTMFSSADFTGDLYVKVDVPWTSGYHTYYIRVPYRLEKWQ